MCDEVKDIVPKGYRVNHLSFKKRTALHHGKVNGQQMEFNILCKVSVNYSPRDLTKLKQDLANYAAYLGKELGNDHGVIYQKLLEATHEKMVPGMGMRLAFSMAYIDFITAPRYLLPFQLLLNYIYVFGLLKN